MNPFPANNPQQLLKKQLGITVLELLTVLSVIAIMAAIAIPGFNELTLTNRASSQVNALSGHLAFARSEALNRNQTITLCGSTNLTACNSSNWEEGRIIFVDSDSDGVIDAGDGDEIIKIHPPITGDNTLRRIAASNPDPDDFDDAFIRFKGDATLVDGDASNFTFCDERGDIDARVLLVNTIGQVRTGSDSDSNNIDEIFVNGNPIDTSCP